MACSGGGFLAEQARVRCCALDSLCILGPHCYSQQAHMSTAYDVAVDAIKAGLPRCHERLRTDIYKGAQPGVRSDLRITSEAKAAALGAPARKRTTGRDILRALENRHRWLLFAQHCYTCQLPDGACELGKLCTYGKKTLKHVSHCEAERDECPYPRCRLLKPLLSHSSAWGGGGGRAASVVCATGRRSRHGRWARRRRRRRGRGTALELPPAMKFLQPGGSTSSRWQQLDRLYHGEELYLPGWPISLIDTGSELGGFRARG